MTQRILCWVSHEPARPAPTSWPAVGRAREWGRTQHRVTHGPTPLTHTLPTDSQMWDLCINDTDNIMLHWLLVTLRGSCLVLMFITWTISNRQTVHVRTNTCLDARTCTYMHVYACMHKHTHSNTYTQGLETYVQTDVHNKQVKGRLYCHIKTIWGTAWERSFNTTSLPTPPETKVNVMWCGEVNGLNNLSSTLLLSQPLQIGH